MAATPAVARARGLPGTSRDSNSIGWLAPGGRPKKHQIVVRGMDGQSVASITPALQRAEKSASCLAG